jgi:PilZ domain
MVNEPAERRQSRRYVLHLPIHYRVAERGALPCTGSGTTCEISTGGLSFRCRRMLPVGAHVELTLDWPSKHEDRYPVELLMTGFILRSNERGRVSVRVTSHRFRVDSSPAVVMGAIA